MILLCPVSILVIGIVVSLRRGNARPFVMRTSIGSTSRRILGEIKRLKSKRSGLKPLPVRVKRGIVRVRSSTGILKGECRDFKNKYKPRERELRSFLHSSRVKGGPGQ